MALFDASLLKRSVVMLVEAPSVVILDGAQRRSGIQHKKQALESVLKRLLFNLFASALPLCEFQLYTAVFGVGFVGGALFEWLEFTEASGDQTIGFYAFVYQVLNHRDCAGG